MKHVDKRAKSTSWRFSWRVLAPDGSCLSPTLIFQGRVGPGGVEVIGFHTLELPATVELDAMQRDLEDRRWFREGGVYVKKLASPTIDAEPRLED